MVLMANVWHKHQEEQDNASGPKSVQQKEGGIVLSLNIRDKPETVEDLAKAGNFIHCKKVNFLPTDNFKVQKERV